MVYKKLKVVVVDGYSTGVLIAPIFESYGIECVHVQSAPEIPECFRGQLDPGQYAATFRSPAEFLQAVQGLGDPLFLAVLPGSEMGVLAADRLGQALGLANVNVP